MYSNRLGLSWIEEESQMKQQLVVLSSGINHAIKCV